MKKTISKVIGSITKFSAPLALALAIMTENSTCFCFTYQPTPPACLKKYRNKV